MDKKMKKESDSSLIDFILQSLKGLFNFTGEKHVSDIL